MKNLVPFLTALIQTVCLTHLLDAQAQQPNAFTSSTGVWHVADTYPQGSQEFPGFLATTTTVFYYAGDTVADGETYLAMWSTPDEDFTSPTDINFRGHVRSEGGRVYLLDTVTGQPRLLYDFSLEVGDSALFDFVDIGQYYLTVESVDSIELQGTQHRRLYFGEPPPMGFFVLNEVWIEGIGSLHGPLFPSEAQVFDDQGLYLRDLTCFALGDGLLWSNPDYDDCYIYHMLPTAIGSDKRDDFSVYPNPVAELLMVEFPIRLDTNIQTEIVDMLGKQIPLTIIRNDQRKLTIDMRNMDAGTYALRLKVDSEWVVRKVVKQ